ncbi:MAG TPA: DUF1800 domain-containing protein [Gemmatimonadaceae bacterium]|nr:DUF1800 domain-containing protein [Gemmatimonadaceae bacterium]
MQRITTTLCVAAAALLAYAEPAAPAIAPSRVPSQAAREQTADQQVRQALNRLAFGPRPGDYARVRAMGVDAWIARQLEPQTIDDGATDQFIAAHFPTLAMSPPELMRAFPPPRLLRTRTRRRGAQADSASMQAGAPTAPIDSASLRRARKQARRLIAEMQAAKTARAVMSNRQLQEVMVDFWENHFNVFAGKGPERYYLAAYDRDVIRPHALGHFRDLLEAVARSPAMLFYLDNWESTADSGRPVLGGRRNGVRGERRNTRGERRKEKGERRKAGINENYGRELMELHTISVNGGYTQQDVINVARALTGWTIAGPRRGGGFVFRPAWHDAGTKVVLGHTLPAGRGIQDGEEVLDILAESPATAHFISTELVRRFVSDSPPPSLVARADSTFVRTDGDIREVLRTIFTSPEFFSRAAYRAKVKNPFELVASALRAVGASADSTPRTAQVVARLGEPLFLHRDPNGYPETGEAWINTGAILNRINFGMALARGRLPGVSLARWENDASLTSASRDKQVDAVVDEFLGGEASPETRAILESGVNPLAREAEGGGREERGERKKESGGAVSQSVSGSAGQERLGGATSSPPRVVPQLSTHNSQPTTHNSLSLLVGLALGAPEFQRR